MRNVFTFFLLLIFTTVFSQKKLTEKQIDSIQSTIFTTNADNVDRIETITTELYLKSKEIEYEKGQIEALLRRAAFRVNSRKFDFVEQDLNEAINISNEIGDYYSVARAKTIEASMLNTLKLYSETQKVLDDSFSIVNKIEDVNKRRLMETFFYGRYINLYGNQEQEDLVRYYADKRLKTALLLPETEKEKPLIIISTARLFCIHYLKMKDVKKVEYYLGLQEKYINKTDNLFDLTFYHKTKAKFIYENKNTEKDYLDKALYHYKLAEKYGLESKNPMLLEAVYPEIAKIYEDKKNEKEQALYIKRYGKLKDSITPKENKIIEKLVFHSNKPQEKKNIKEDLQEKENPGRSYFFYVLLLFAVVICGFLVYKKYFSKKNTFLIPQNSIKNVPNGNDYNEINKKLKQLAFNDNVAFLPSLLEVYPKFQENLLTVNPSLSSSDIEFCGYLKLKLNAQQISSSKKISLRAVDSKKYRIRKKLGIASHEDLYQWMINK